MGVLAFCARNFGRKIKFMDASMGEGFIHSRIYAREKICGSARQQLLGLVGIAEVPVNPVYFFIARDVLYRARVN